MGSIKEALTFDDVTLAPNYSEVLPSEVSTKTIYHIKLGARVSFGILIINSDSVLLISTSRCVKSP